MWIRQNAQGRFYFTIPNPNEELLRPAEFYDGSLYHRAYIAFQHVEPDKNKPWNVMSLTEKFHFDLEQFFAYTSVESKGLAHPANAGRHANQSDWYLRALLGAHTEVHPATVIPDTLLQGPYQAEGNGSVEIGEMKMLRLFWLVRGEACIQPQRSFEVTRLGFSRIIDLIVNADPDKLGVEESLRRLRLAERLFLLFKLLRVFKTWPNCTFLLCLDSILTEKQSSNMRERLTSF